MKKNIFSKKSNNSEFEHNNVFFQKNSKIKEKNRSKNEENDDSEKLSNAFKNINNLLSNCIESIRVKEKDIETINSPVFKSVSRVIKKNNISSKKVVKYALHANTKKTFNLNKSNSLSNSNHHLIKNTEEHLLQSLNMDYENKKKNFSLKKEPLTKMKKTKTNKTEKSNTPDEKISILTKNNTIVSSKFKNSKTVKFLLGKKKEENLFKKKNTAKLKKTNSLFSEKEMNKNSTLHSNFSFKSTKTVKAKNRNNEFNGLRFNFNNVESYSPKSFKINKSKRNKKVSFQEKKFKRRKYRLKTFGYLSNVYKNEINSEKRTSKDLLGHSSKKNAFERNFSNCSLKEKRPNTTIVSNKKGENIIDIYLNNKNVKKKKIMKNSKKSMKILTIKQIGKNVKQSLIGLNYTDIRKELYELENNDISEAIKSLPTKYYSSLNDYNDKEKFIPKKETNKYKTEINSNDSSEIKSKISEKSNNKINKYQQKYRKLFLIKKVYDSLDDEELPDEEEIFFFYLSPNSIIVYLVDSLVFISSFILLVYLPAYLGYKINFCREKFSFELITFYIFDLIYILDLILGFFRAYYNFEEYLIKNNVDMFLHYFKGWFFFDFLEAIPFYSIFSIKEHKCNENISHNIYIGNFTNFHYSLLIIKIFKIFKAFNHNKAYNKIIDLLNRSDFFSNWNGVLFTLLVTLSLIHFCSCFFIYLGRNFYPGWILVRKIQDNSFLDIYVTAVYYLMTTLTTVGYGDIIVLTIYERIYQIILLIVGTCAYSWILTFISNYIKKMNERYIDFENKVQILGDIRMSYPLLKNDLYEKIVRYLKYNKAENKYNINYILESLPLSLKNNVIIEMYKPIIKNFHFFKSFQNSDFFVKIVTSLKPVLSIKDDILVQEGDVIEDIIFIKRGVLSLEICIDLDCPQESCEAHLVPDGNITTLDLQRSIKTGKIYNSHSHSLTSSIISYNKNNTKNKNEILNSNKKQINIINLRKNEHYGDILMILNERSPLTVKVKSKKAELFFLQKTDATEISNKYPNIWKRIVHKSLFNIKQIRNLIRKKIIIFCDLNGIWINPELRKNADLDLSEQIEIDTDKFYTKNKVSKYNIKDKQNKTNDSNLINNNNHLKSEKNNHINTIIYEVDENAESNRNSIKNNENNSEKKLDLHFSNKKDMISEISKINSSEKNLGFHFSNKKDKIGEINSLLSSNKNIKSGLKEFLNKSICSNSFRKNNLDNKDTFLTFNSNSSNSNNSSNSIKISFNSNSKSFQEIGHEKETEYNKSSEDKNSEGSQCNKTLCKKINKMLTAIEEKMKPNNGQINNFSINFYTHKTVNFPLKNRRNSEPSFSKRLNHNNEEEEDIEDINEEIYSDEDFNISIEKDKVYFGESDKNNNIIYPFINEIYNKNDTNLPKLLEKNKNNTSSSKSEDTEGIKSSSSKKSDLIKSSRFSNLYTSTSTSFAIKSIYENMNILTGYKIQKDKILQQKIKKYILNECFQNIMVSDIRKNSNYQINKADDKRKINLSALMPRNSRFSKTSSIVGNTSSKIISQKKEKEDNKSKIKTRNSVKIRKIKVTTDNSNIINKFQKSIDEKLTKNQRKKRRNTNVFRQINYNNNASFLDYSNISNIHALVPHEESIYYKKKTSRRPNLILNDEEEMSFYTKMKTIRNIKNNNNSYIDNNKSFIAKPNEINLMDKISQNIQKNKQNLNNPEEYFSGFFTNLLQRKKTMAKGLTRANKNNEHAIKRNSTSSDTINRNNPNFQFNINI